MKILIVSPYLPHPKCGHGTGVFMYGLLTRFGKKHEITVVSFASREERALAATMNNEPFHVITVPRDKGAQKDVVSLLSLLLNRAFAVLRSFIFWQPYFVCKYRHSGMAKLLRQLTSETKYDIVQLELVQMAQFKRFLNSGKTVLHEHDVAYRPAYRRYKNAQSSLKRFASLIEWCQWSRYEPEMIKRFDHILTVTDQDRVLLEWLTGRSHISYFPRGTNVPEPMPPYANRAKRTMLFIGSFTHSPNVDAAKWLIREIVPLVVQQAPDARCDIIGPDAPKELIDEAREVKGVRFLGFVDDIVPYLEHSSVYIAPMRFGGGIKIKVLQAMAYGIPVVTTKIGIEGIEGASPEIAMTGTSAKELSDHIIVMFQNPALAESIGKNSYETMKRYYSWEGIILRLENIYTKVLNGA